MRLAIRSRVTSHSFRLRRCNRYSELNRIFDDTQKPIRLDTSGRGNRMGTHEITREL
jgi:hypothetical protein